MEIKNYKGKASYFWNSYC